MSDITSRLHDAEAVLSITLVPPVQGIARYWHI